ncbi:MAG TPA: DUF2169 domain-containing protein [Polyangia bacterium]|jgi:hypothetical protein
MGHPAIENNTPFAFQALFLVDEEFRPLVVPLVKATFTVAADGRCALAEKQVPPNLEGECWGDDPETSSYKYEPEVAFMKPATDVVLIGHAWAPDTHTTEMRVGLRVGALSKQLLVTGDRVWFRTAGIVSATRPRPFEKIPLVYERAFGGWDRGHADESKHTFEVRNPVGTGYRRSGGFAEDLHLPNIEDPRSPISGFGDRPAPAGCGFVSPHWQPRAQLAGTFDEAWQEKRAPLLPKDFERRHLNAASPGLVADGYLRGDETVAAVGLTPAGRWHCALPGLPPPPVEIELVGGAVTPLPLNLDTVIIEPDERRVMLLWRGHLALRTGPHDVKRIAVGDARTAPLARETA